MPASRASSGELNSRFGSGIPHLVATTRMASGKLTVFKLHDEGEDVAFFVAAEAVEVVVGGVDGEGAGFFFVKGAETGVVLRAGFAQLDVVADDADDVGLLLDGLCEVVGHGAACCWTELFRRLFTSLAGYFFGRGEVAGCVDFIGFFGGGFVKCVFLKMVFRW